MWLERDNTRAPLFLWGSTVGDPPPSVRKTTAERDQTWEAENTLDRCVRVASALHGGFGGFVLAHADCLNDRGLLFLPHPHLSVRADAMKIHYANLGWLFKQAWLTWYKAYTHTLTQQAFFTRMTICQRDMHRRVWLAAFCPAVTMSLASKGQHTHRPPKHTCSTLLDDLEPLKRPLLL